MPAKAGRIAREKKYEYKTNRDVQMRVSTYLHMIISTSYRYVDYFRMRTCVFLARVCWALCQRYHR